MSHFSIAVLLDPRSEGEDETAASHVTWRYNRVVRQAGPMPTRLATSARITPLDRVCLRDRASRLGLADLLMRAEAAAGAG
jgi:hypothetical protein